MSSIYNFNVPSSYGSSGPLIEQAVGYIGKYINKLVDDYASFQKAIEALCPQLPSCPEKGALEAIAAQLRMIDPARVLQETGLVLASNSQFTMPSQAGNLANSACSCMAGESLYQTLTDGILNAATADGVLTTGMTSYFNALGAINAKNSVLRGQLNPGAYIAWEGEAKQSFNGRLVPVGQGTIQATISPLDPAASYLNMLQQLSNRSRTRPIGAIVHTGGAFFLSIAIHSDAEGNPVVFLYDSHGSRGLTQNINAPAFSARSPSLESAARLLALLYPSLPRASEDDRTATFYPLQSTKMATSFASLSFPIPVQYAANTWQNEILLKTAPDDVEVKQFIGQLEKAEQIIQQKLSSTHSTKSNLHALLMNICETSIFPSLLKASLEQQKILLATLDTWLQHLLPLLPCSKASTPPHKEAIELTTQLICSFAEFLKDYKVACQKSSQNWVGRFIRPMSHEAMDRQIASQLTSTTPKQQILKSLVKELVSAAGLEFSEPFCASAASLLEQVIEKALHSSLPAEFMQHFLDDKTALEGLSKKDAAAPTPMPLAMQKALVKAADGLIDLGNPDIMIRFTKFLLLRNSIVSAIGRLVSYFSKAAEKEPDIAAFAIHLLRKYTERDSKIISSPQDLSKQLSERIFKLAVLDQIPSDIAKTAIVTFKNYSPLMNLPACAGKMSNEIFLLLQRPEVLSAFIYEYLLKKTVIPNLAKQNAARTQVESAKTIPLFNQIGLETASFIGQFIKDYVASSLIKESALTQSTIGALQEGLVAFLPKAIAEKMAVNPSALEQHRICDFLESTAYFMEDFVFARQTVDRTYPGGKEAYTQTERSAALHSALNQARMKRGAPLLKREDKQEKLISLSKMLLQNSPLTEREKNAAQEILPSLLETAIAQLQKPLLHQLLLSLLTPNQAVETAPLSGLGNLWATEAIERWNKGMAHLLKSAVRLSEIDTAASAVVVPLLQKLLEHAGKQIASLGSLPKLISDPAGQLNFIRRLRASLWTQGIDGRLIPTMGSAYGLSSSEKEELKNSVAQLIRQQLTLPVDILPINEVIHHFSDAFLELIEDPAILETFVYQYIIEDTLLPQSPASLNASGLHFEPNLTPTIENALASPNFALWMSMLQEWQSNGWIPAGMSTTPEIIKHLSLSKEDSTFLNSLNDHALVAAYLDYALHNPNRKNSLESVTTQELTLKFVQRSGDEGFALTLPLPQRMKHPSGTPSPAKDFVLCKPNLSKNRIQKDEVLLRSLRQSLNLSQIITDIANENSQLTEEECTVRAVTMLLKRSKLEFDADTLNSLKQAKQPLLFLSRFLSGLKQVAFWQRHMEAIYQSDNLEGATEFTREFAASSSHLFGFPFTLRQRAAIYSQLQGPLKQASWQGAQNIPMDWTGPIETHVCKDSAEGIRQKLGLLRKATRSVVLSGSYFGGNPLTQALLILRGKLQENPDFKVYMLGSEYMLKSENRTMFKELENAYPDRFHVVINHEVNPFTNPQTGSFFLMCNHVKLLVIDEGTDFLIGGSGIEERWSLEDGTRKINAAHQSTGEPMAFRDIDYLFSSGRTDGIGRLMHHKLLELCAHCSYFENDDMAKRYFDPRFYPVTQVAKKQPATNDMSQTRVEFFATNPEEAAANAYERRLIELIEMAEGRIVIDHMYFHPSEPLLQALIRASHRDVSIILVTNQDGPETPGTHKLFVPRSRYLWKRLFEGRQKDAIAVFEYQVPYTTLHKKIIIVDDCVATGSSNCGLLSLQGMNHEYNVIVHSKDIVEKTLETIEADIVLSRPVLSQEAIDLTSSEIAAGLATAPLGYLL